MGIPAAPKPQAEFIWFDGDLVPWADARVHVLSHVLHYGSSVFEGIRCYETPDGPAVFRLPDHVERLFFSARVMRMEFSYSPDEILEACLETIRRNEFLSCYIRPLIFRGAGAMGVLPRDNPCHVTIATWPWGAYLGKEGLEEGIDVMVSSWRKMPPNTIPPLAKIGGAYVLGSLAKMEAVRLGYAEALLLDTDGRVAEGSGENLFAVVNGRLQTPPLSHSVLCGITRRSVMELAGERGIEVVEQPMSRAALYMAEELFFTGTAAEVTPIRSVDGIPVGNGKVGPITRMLQQDFFNIVNGRVPDRHRWLTPARKATGARRP
jgi:branched-chain amino acid aminotransferase